MIYELSIMDWIDVFFILISSIIIICILEITIPFIIKSIKNNIDEKFLFVILIITCTFYWACRFFL